MIFREIAERGMRRINEISVDNRLLKKSRFDADREERSENMYWMIIILLLIPQIVRAECAWILWMKYESIYTLSSETEKDLEIIQAGKVLKEC
jgi:hypothetical protein